MEKGKFHGRVAVVWLKDGRKMKLLEEFTFHDAAGMVWTAPKGSVVDGASIPKFFWPVIGSPFVGKYRRASVIHDVYCVNMNRSYESVHEMFHEAMLVDGVSPSLAQQMYMAVSQFGPKWTVDDGFHL